MQIWKKIRNLYFLLKKTIFSMIRNDGFEMSGYLAFLTLISIFPCTIFVAKVLALLNVFFISEENTIFGRKVIDDFIGSFDFLSNLPLQTLKDEIKKILVIPPKTLINFAIIGILWTSSSAMQGLKTSLNRAYGVPNKKPYVIIRLYSIFQFIIVSFVTIIIISLISIVPLVLKKFHIESFQFLNSLRIGIFILWFYVIWLSKMLTNKDLKLSKIFIGSTVTVIAWSISSKILMIYFTKFLQFNIIYGSLANIVSILLFFYVIFICFIFGAELNHQIEKENEERLRHFQNNK